MLKSKLKFDDAFNYKTTDNWSKKLKELAPGAPNPCHCCSQTCPVKIHVPRMGALTAADGVNIYFENVGGKVSGTLPLSVSSGAFSPSTAAAIKMLLGASAHR